VAQIRSKRSRLLLRLQRLVFVVLLLAIAGLSASLSVRYNLTQDWTATGRHSLSDASRQLLDQLDQPLRITAYAREEEVLRQRISTLVQRYQRHKSDIVLNFVNPDAVPDQLREMGITSDGELVIEYAGRSEHLQAHNEQALTNALHRIARSGERWLVFLAGHGERQPDTEANHHLRDWVHQVENKGISARSVNLAQTGAIPDNTSALVIADPRTELLPGEIKLIIDYVNGGGNLLWMTEPDSSQQLLPLAELLGVEFLPGIIIDPTARQLGITHPAVVVVTRYGLHDVTSGFEYVSLLPQVRPLLLVEDSGWNGAILMESSTQSWSETGALKDSVRFDEDADLPGPLAIGIALSREVEPTAEQAEPKNQRVVVLGDADFLSNAYVGNSGNLELGMRIINWLVADDAFIDVPVRTATDQQLELSSAAGMIIGFGFLFVLPLALVVTGITLWWRRRRA